MTLLGGLERNPAFHLSLGSTFAKIRTRQHLLSALDEFQQAIELTGDSEDMWLAHWNKATVLYALGDFEDAVTAASSAWEVLPEYRSYNRSQILRLIRDANQQLGDRDAAFETAVKARESAPNDPAVTFSLILTAHRARNYSETVKIMRSALESSEGAYFLGNIIRSHTPERYTTEYMSIACAEMGDLDLARDVFQAMKSNATGHDLNRTIGLADAALARLYFGFYRDDEKAIALWEDNVRDHPHTEPAFDAAFALMPLYFTNAQNAGPDEEHTWVSKMEQLVDRMERMAPDLNMAESRHEVSALLGRWYADHGNMEQARSKIHTCIKESIRDLTDRDDSNDYWAYMNLGRALLCFGDRKNAAIAYAFTKPLLSAEEQMGENFETYSGSDTTATPAIFVDPASNAHTNLFGRCDGGCDRRESSFKSFGMCEICIDVTFCDECHEKVRSGTTRFRMCNPQHPFFEIYPPRGLVTKDLEGYKVHLDENKTVAADEWLSMISRDWFVS